MGDLDHLWRLKQEHKERLHSLPNVNGVGIGRRLKGGKTSEEFVIGVTVTRKLSRAELSEDELVPATLEMDFRGGRISARTDVLEVGELEFGEEAPSRANEFQVRKRPLQGGYSIAGADKVTTGTLGCFIVAGGKVYGLTNLHVTQKSVFKVIRQPILQPSREDRGTPADAVGDVVRYVPLKSGQTATVDGALFEVDSRNCTAAIPGLGMPKGSYNQLNLGWHLTKVGRTTGRTEGHITLCEYSCDVPYDGVKIHFEHQVFIHNFPWGTAIAGGDSGAVWMTDDGYVGALNFAGNGTGGHSVATPIAWAMHPFRASIWAGRSRTEADEDEPEALPMLDPEDAPFSAEIMEIIREEISGNAAEDLQ
jgi:hypothetical protein